MFSPSDELAVTERVMMSNMHKLSRPKAATRAGNSSSGRSPCCIAKYAAAARDCASILA